MSPRRPSGGDRRGDRPRKMVSLLEPDGPPDPKAIDGRAFTPQTSTSPPANPDLPEKCPECGGAWTHFDLPGAAVRLHCGTCRGDWLNREGFDNLGAQGKRLPLERPSEEVELEAEFDLPCPACGEPTETRVWGHRAQTTEAQVCTACGGLWFGDGDLPLLLRLGRERIQRDLNESRTIAQAGEKKLQTRSRGLDAPGVTERNTPAMMYLLRVVFQLPQKVGLQRKRFPAVTVTLMALNLLAYVVTYALVDDPNRVMQGLGLIPADLLQGRHLYTLVTSAFTHAGVAHLLGNLYFLWLFGENVEDELGPGLTLGLYGLAHVGAMVAHSVVYSDLSVPCVGASGAVSGLMGAFLMLYPRAWIVQMFVTIPVPVPAWFYLGIWTLVWEVLGAYAQTGGVAHAAHVGGLLVGIVGVLSLLALDIRQRPKPPGRTSWKDELDKVLTG